MKRYQLSYAISSFVALLVAPASVPVHAQHAGHGGTMSAEPARPYTEKLKIGKDGTVAFAGATVLGEWILKPGTYRFEHAVEGADHFVAFTPSDAPPSEPPSVRVRCRLEGMKKPAKKTEVYAQVNSGGMRQLERIEVQGESVRHVF